jgi:hypothetical protein
MLGRMPRRLPLRARRRAALLAAPLAIAALVLALAACTATPRPTHTPTATSTPSGGKASAFAIKVGDCLDDAGIQGTTTTAPIVPCTGQHDSEAYGRFLLTDAEYPGEDKVKSEARAGCSGTAFANFVGIASVDSTLQFSYYFPTADSWASGDREVMCTIYQVDGAGKPIPTTGTLKDAAR